MQVSEKSCKLYRHFKIFIDAYITLSAVFMTILSGNKRLLFSLIELISTAK